MSRHSTTRDLTPIFEAAELWRERCLIGDGSLFEEGLLWVEALLKEALSLIDAAKPSGEGSWVDQFAEYFEPNTKIRQLIAEVLWVFYLFPEGTGTRKRENLTKLWMPPASSPLLRDAVMAGIALPGQAYFRHAWREIRYILEVAHFVKRYDTDKRQHLFRHAEDLAKCLDDLAIGQSRASRHTLLYLLFPDEMEPLVSFTAKRSALSRHDVLPPTTNDFTVDRALAQLRASQKSQDFALFTKPPKSVTAKTWIAPLAKAQAKSDTISRPFQTPPNAGDTVYFADPVAKEIIAWGKVGEPDLADDLPDHWAVAVQPIKRSLAIGAELNLSPDLKVRQVEDSALRRIENALQSHFNRPVDLWPDDIGAARNVIYYGPPGTGKTRQLLEHCQPYEAGDGDPNHRRWEMVTFHANYGYEEFVEGFRPNAEGKLKLCRGIFRKLCARAKADQGRRYALFIDEFNRGNLTAILGELITLLDPDKRCVWGPDGRLRAGQEVCLAYSKKPFGVPKNLDLFASMNTADRSLVHIDLALRRRFDFVACPPMPELIPPLAITDGEPLDLASLLRRLNERIAFLLDEDHLLGHSYFLFLTDWNDLTSRLTQQIFPMLEELFHDDFDALSLVLGNELVSDAPFDATALFKADPGRNPRRRRRFKSAEELTPTMLKNLLGP